MKKFILISTFSLLLLIGIIYLLLFTKMGNDLLKPSLQAKINEQSPVELTLSEFQLDMSHIRILLVLDDENTFLAEGNYSLFSQGFDIDYSIGLKKLSNLNNLSKRKLSGSLLSEGNIKGDITLFKIKGKSNLARSKTDYAIVIEDMQLNKAAIKLSNAKIQELLTLVGEAPYAKGKIDLYVQLNDLDPRNMKGSVLLNIKEASLNAKTLKKEFDLNIKKTSLKGEFRAKLEGVQINYLTRLNSELANIHSNGKIKTDDSAIDSSYSIDIKELALFKSVTNAPLRGPFFTEGKVAGNTKKLAINGTSNLADSQTDYKIELKDLKPKEVLIHIKEARLERLLYMTGEEKYAKAKLNADIQLNNLDPEALEGNAHVSLSEGKINTELMKKAFEVSLPQTTFTLDAKTHIKPDNVNYNISFLSNLAKIKSHGDVNPQTLHTKADYTIDIKELALLKPISNLPLRGPIATSGTLTGDKEELLIKGSSNLALSKTDYDFVLKELQPHQAKIAIEKAKLSKILYLLEQPDYAEGKLDATIHLDSISTLNGKIKLAIANGLVHKKVIHKSFDMKLPYTKFELNSDAVIKDDRLKAKTTLTSNLATLKMKQTQFNIKTAYLKSDYNLFIPFLQRLEPLLERKLYGELKINGELKKEKNLTLTAQSKIFQGQLNATIIGNNLAVDFKDLHALDILKMMDYPQVIDAPLNGTLVYNTKNKKGKLNSHFEGAMLTRSKMTDLVNTLTHKDLTKEHFNKGSLISLINKEIITSDLQMISKDVSIKSKKLIIDSKQQLIDSRFALKVKKHPGDIIIKGNINTPSVKLDAKSMITPEIEEKVGKELNRFLKKLF